MGRREQTALCAGCGARRAADELIRIVDDRQGTLIPDLKGKIPGKAAFVCPERSCIESLSPDQLAHTIAAALADQVRDLLRIAQGGRHLVSGSDRVKIEARRGAGKGWLALIADDASEATASKLMRSLDAHGVATRRLSTTSELGDAVDKTPRSVVLIKDRGLAAAACRAIDRHHQVRGR